MQHYLTWLGLMFRCVFCIQGFVFIILQQAVKEKAIFKVMVMSDVMTKVLIEQIIALLDSFLSCCSPTKENKKETITQ